MLTLLLLALGLCQEPYVTLHLAVSDASTNPLVRYRFGPHPRFTSCSHCTEVAFDLTGRSGRIHLDPKPLVRIGRSQIASAAIEAITPIYHPETRVYLLHLFPKEEISKRLAKLTRTSPNELLVRMHCSEIIDIGRVSPVISRSLRAGQFYSSREAQELAKRLDLNATIIPFDAERDERNRIESLRVALGEYAGLPDQRQKIREREPELYDFLEKHPEYWRELGEVEKEMEEWARGSRK